ncbi:MAG TPA: leucine-rich repeat domain-containing protein, partial [Candidatus Paceibacterota bacterium]|nr:leucine-rich repeat domain-containing protein [Candidatus Paceibacterota bacterium]
RHHAGRLLPLLLLILSATVRGAHFNYSVSEGKVTITKYTGPGGAVTIPDTIESLPVTGIGEYAFSNCARLTSITIGNGVTSIGDGAFNGCAGLTSITIPDSVTSIGDNAFQGCTGLTAVMIGNGVTSIGGSAFQGCTNLVSVTIPDSVTSIGAEAFRGCTSLTSIGIPSSVTEWGRVRRCYFGGFPDSAPFADCIALTTVTIDDGVQLIPDHAFSGCTSLTTITIPDSVTSIGDYAFASCTNLTTVTIGNRVTSISGSAFGDYDVVFCTGLESVYFRGDAPEDSWAFWECPATIYYLPGTVGWETTFSARPTAPWVLPNPVILGFGPSFGVHTNQFGFIISWATNDIPVAVEACTDPTQSVWAPVGSVTLRNGSAYFSDADWANHPARFYRVRSE